MELTEQERRREWFREHWASGIPFNKHCGIEVRQWDSEAVELFLPYAEGLSAHDGIFHGGVVAALLDTTGSGAVLAGHDFDKGSRLTSISLSVQYLTVAPSEDLLAVGRCTRRGRSVHFAETRACGAASGSWSRPPRSRSASPASAREYRGGRPRPAFRRTRNELFQVIPNGRWRLTTASTKTSPGVPSA
jgi:uncharacterized protein (TIGR00369 family)